MTVAAHEPFHQIFEAHETTVRFEVTNVNSLVAFDHRLGAVAPLLEWESRSMDRASSADTYAAPFGPASSSPRGVATHD